MAEYRTIAADLRRRIQSGELPAGSRLPTLVELCHDYSASMNTVRRAELALSHEGLLFLRRGYPAEVLGPARSVRRTPTTAELVAEVERTQQAHERAVAALLERLNH